VDCKGVIAISKIFCRKKEEIRSFASNCRGGFQTRPYQRRLRHASGAFNGDLFGLRRFDLGHFEGQHAFFFEKGLIQTWPFSFLVAVYWG
jgi:hypothetical protein